MNQVLTFPVYGTCDWGDCDEQATAWRWDEVHGWLPVCLAHSFRVVLS